MSRLLLWGGVALFFALVGAWFLQQPPEEVAAWAALPEPVRRPPPPPPPSPEVAPAPVPSPVPTPTPELAPPLEHPRNSGPIAPDDPPGRAGPIVAPEDPRDGPRRLPPAPRRKKCLALTWSVLETENGVVTMGSVTGQSDPYKGDTPCSASLPLLCLKPGHAPLPKGVESPMYRGWSGAEVAATKPVLGLEVRSLEEADRMCASVFGEGWRMGAFHDGGGWGLKGFGTIPVKTRLWVTIRDQRANLWD